MKKYRFHTSATMKEYNCDKWWIDRGIIPDMSISADSVRSALEIYRQRVNDEHYITISANAMKNKAAMYRDMKDGSTIQTGYVLTAKSYFEDRSANVSSYQYIELWVEITELCYPDFDAA